MLIKKIITSLLLISINNNVLLYNKVMENIIIETTSIVILIQHINRYNPFCISSSVSRILTTNYVLNERTHLNFIRAVKTIINNIIIDNFIINDYILYIIHCTLEHNTDINIDKYTIYDIINILNNNSINNTLHPNTYFFIYVLLIYSYNSSNSNNSVNIASTSGVGLIDGLYYEIRFSATNNIKNIINNYIMFNKSIL